MTKVTIRGILAHKIRLLLTTMAVVVGVAFVTGTFIFTDTLDKSFDELFGKIYQNIDVVVQGQKVLGTAESNPGDDTAPLPESVLQTVRETDGVQSAEGIVSGYALLLDKDGEPMGSQQGPPTLGSSWVNVEELNIADIVKGHEPTNSNEVVIDAKSAKDGGYKVGDKINVVFPEKRGQFTVAGIVQVAGEDSLGGSTFAGFTLPTIREMLGTHGTYNIIYADVKDGVDINKTIATLNHSLPKDIRVQTGLSVGQEGSNDIKKAIAPLQKLLLVFGGISLFVATFIIANTFSILVAQKTRELALLRALGASRRQVINSVLFEAGVVGIISATIGLGLGFLLTIALQQLMKLIGADFPDTSLQLLPRTVIAAYAVGLIVTEISALFPARRASRIPPVAAIRAGAAELGSPTKKRLVTAAALFAVGIILLATGLYTEIYKPLILIGIGAALSLLGMSLATAFIVNPAVYLLSKLFLGVRIVLYPIRLGFFGIRKLFFAIFRRKASPLVPFKRTKDTPATLGDSNTRRSPRRTSSTASALMIGVALVAMMAIVTESLKSSLLKLTNDSLPADIMVYSNTQGGFSDTINQKVSQLPDIKTSGAIQSGFFREGDKTHQIAGVEPQIIGSTLIIKMTSGTDALDADQLLIDEDVAKKDDLKVGSKITATFPQVGKKDLVVGGIYEKNPIAGAYLVSTKQFKTLYLNALDVVILIKAEKDNIAPLQAKIEKIVKDAGYKGVVQVENQAEFRKSNEKQLNAFLGIVIVLLLLSLIIAILGVVNTLALSVVERTRELGLLRAVGMSRKQVKRMIRSESTMIAVLGAFLGLVMGTIFGTLLVKSLGDEGIEVLRIPVFILIGAVVAAAFAGILAAAFPARRAAKTKVLEALATN